MILADGHQGGELGHLELTKDSLGLTGLEDKSKMKPHIYVMKLLGFRNYCPTVVEEEF
jgi:hypothetical protein